MPTSALAPLGASYFYSDFYLHLWNQEGVCGRAEGSQPQELTVFQGGLGRTHVTQPRGAALMGFIAVRAWAPTSLQA